MWWLYYNAGQLITLIASFGFLPHYTVAFKPFFEFIVLGIIPGTSFELGFVTSLLIAWFVLSIALLSRVIHLHHTTLHVQH